MRTRDAARRRSEGPQAVPGLVNPQTGTGNRIEFWNTDGTPFDSKGKFRRYVDIGRLNKGR